MKAKIEIDLKEAFIGYGDDGEEFSADFGDAIKSAVVEYIVNKYTNNISNTIREKIDAALDVFIKKGMDSKVDDILSNFMERPVVISNGYKTDKYDSLTEYVEHRMAQVYRAEFGGKTCGKDVLIDKINSAVKSAVISEISPIQKNIEREAKAIAREEIGNNNFISSITKVLEGK